MDESNIKILNSKRDVLPEYSGQSVVIVSYDLMVNLKSILANAKCNVVILDESHHIKNFKTQRYKAAEPILKVSIVSCVIFFR